MIGESVDNNQKQAYHWYIMTNDKIYGTKSNTLKQLLLTEEGGGDRLVAKMWSPSSRDSKGTPELSWLEELEELESWSISGMGPAVQVSLHQLSAF